MKTLFIVRYSAENDMFRECGDVFTEKEFRVARALVPGMRLVEVHGENGIENDRMSRPGWREKWEPVK